MIFNIGDEVRCPYGIGIVVAIRGVVGTKHQSNKRNKIDYLIDFNNTINKKYVDWFEDYNVKKTRSLRVDEAINLYGKIKRVKKVGIYNDRTHFKDNFYLFYDEDEVYHLEDRNKIIATFRANGKENAERLAQQYLF